MRTVYTHDDFDEMSWHDCHVWSLELRSGNGEDDDWTSELVLGIDYIVEWLCGVGVDRRCTFRVAPARLTFHGVTDLRVELDGGDSGFQAALALASIDALRREPVPVQKVHFDRPYYVWTLDLHALMPGQIRFGAYGFTQTLLAEPVASESQSLSLRERDRLLGR